MSVKHAYGQVSAQTVRILTSDPTTRTVEGRLRDGGTIRIWTIGSVPTFFRWPVPGEIWKVNQIKGRWILDSMIQRIDTATDTQRVEDLEPGHAMINAETIKTQDGKTVVTSPLGVDSILPKRIEIHPVMTADDSLDWSTHTASSSVILGVRTVSTGAIGAYRAWNTTLAAGTWELQLLHHQGPDHGIYTITYGDTAIGTIDGYTSGITLNTRTTISPTFTVDVVGNQLLKLTMASKNASSSSYIGDISLILLRRTA